MTAPDGRRWSVRRLVFPRVRGQPSADGLEHGEWGLVDVGDAGLAGIAVVVVGVLVLIFLPYVFFVLELLLLPLYFHYRVLRDKPWTVEARCGSERFRWQVHGWRRAGEVAADVRRSLERGEPPEPRGAARL